MTKVVETLLYTLKPGTEREFHTIMQDISIPLHEKAGMDVVAYGPSLHQADAYLLIRAYRDLDQLTQSQADFYQSADWRSGPRAAIIERIATSLKAVTELPIAAVDALRQRRFRAV